MLEGLREKGNDRLEIDTENGSQHIRQMNVDFQNARDSDGVKQFFENYFTPKSAAIQQKLQKPWEIKL